MPTRFYPTQMIDAVLVWRAYGFAVVRRRSVPSRDSGMGEGGGGNVQNLQQLAATGAKAHRSVQM